MRTAPSPPPPQPQQPQQPSARSPPVFGLEIKQVWAQALLSGAKSVELRAYPLPPAAVGAPVWLLATAGPDGVAVLGDEVASGSGNATVVGFAVFGEGIIYRSATALAADERRHLVPAASPYGWREGTDRLYGWPVQHVRRVLSPAPSPAATRLVRSVYRLHNFQPPPTEGWP